MVAVQVHGRPERLGGLDLRGPVCAVGRDELSVVHASILSPASSVNGPVVSSCSLRLYSSGGVLPRKLCTRRLLAVLVKLVKSVDPVEGEFLDLWDLYRGVLNWQVSLRHLVLVKSHIGLGGRDVIGGADGSGRGTESPRERGAR